MGTVESTAPPMPANRIRNFALFFKNYMSVSSLVVASLPIPATALNLIPVYNSQRELLSVYASLFAS